MDAVEKSRDLQYYKNIDKVYWVVAHDIGNIFKRYEKIPCIFVQHTKDDKYLILKFDYNIEFDMFRYTAWRKVLGQTYGIRVDVLLIKDDKLYTLSGKEKKFSDLGRSEHLIDKQFLAVMDLKK